MNFPQPQSTAGSLSLFQDGGQSSIPAVPSVDDSLDAGSGNTGQDQSNNSLNMVIDDVTQSIAELRVELSQFSQHATNSTNSTTQTAASPTESQPAPQSYEPASSLPASTAGTVDPRNAGEGKLR